MRFFLYTLLFTLSANVIAAQKFSFNYDDVASGLFWNTLYSEGGWTLYCGLKFDSNGKTALKRTLIIEHIYPVNKMFDSLKCKSRMQCRDSNNKKFLRMEADLHNLYPVWLTLNNIYYDTNYGEIDGEDWRFDGCDFERKNGTAEPRPLARGNIARAIFYMHKQYGLPINKEVLSTLKDWNRIDPPSSHEMKRNNKIEQIQGNRNPYIDNPGLADKIPPLD